MTALPPSQTSPSTTPTTEWGDEVMPGVFLTRRTGSAAESAQKTGLGILANTLAYDGSTIDFRKVHDRLKERRALKRRLEESNAYMTKYLEREQRRRAKRMAAADGRVANEAAKMGEASGAAAKMASDNDDDDTNGDLLPITPAEDDRIIEESILENALIIKDCEKEITILMEMVAVQKCVQAGNANEAGAKGGDGGGANIGDLDDDTDEEGEDCEEDDSSAGYGEDDNAPFEDDVTGVAQTSAEAAGRFAL